MSALHPGASVVELPVGPDGAPMWVWCYRPAGLRPDDRVLFALHGVLRNADLYRDNCIRLAQEYRLLLIVPEFSRALFPTNASYNYGNLVGEDGAPNPPSRWSFSVIDRVFDQIRPMTPITRSTYSIFGHSAGAQFVHRWLTLYNPDRVEAAVSANAGAYMLPLLDEPAPFGMGGHDLPPDRLAQLFARPHWLFLGEADNDPADPHLPPDEAARRQGAHRFERGNFYFETARREAARLGVPFNWRLVTVPGIGHEGGLMAAAAAPHLFPVPMD